MHPPSSQASPSLPANHDRPNKSNRKPPNRQHPILPLEHMKTSTTVTTNAPSVQKRSRGDRGVSGHAGRVGPCFIWDVSRNGRPTKALQQRDNKLRTERHLHRDNGAVQGAICQRMVYQRISTAGVRRSWIRDLHLVYLRFPAVSLVRDHESFPNLVPIHAAPHATLVLVHLVA